MRCDGACKTWRKPHGLPLRAGTKARKGQRNCHLCHAEANRRYRASLKQQNEAIRQIAEAHGG